MGETTTSIILCILLLASYIQARKYSIEEIVPKYTLTNHLEIFHDKSGELAFENIKDSSALFSPYQNWIAGLPI